MNRNFSRQVRQGPVNSITWAMGKFLGLYKAGTGAGRARHVSSGTRWDWGWRTRNPPPLEHSDHSWPQHRRDQTQQKRRRNAPDQSPATSTLHTHSTHRGIWTVTFRKTQTFFFCVYFMGCPSKKMKPAVLVKVFQKPPRSSTRNGHWSWKRDSELLKTMSPVKDQLGIHWNFNFYNLIWEWELLGRRMTALTFRMYVTRRRNRKRDPNKVQSKICR